MTGPLDGYVVVDLSHHLAGPYASQRLGDLGAKVIKVEPVGYGEWTRVRPIGNHWIGSVNTSVIAVNRNKESLSVNLKSPEGMEILHKLVERADVFLLNFRPVVAERLGVDYEAVRKIKDDIVYCSVTGFGEDGPYENRPGQDLLIQGFSGVAWNAGRRDDPPIPLGTFVADVTAGMNAATGILAALLHRERTGEGQKVAVNLLHSLIDVQLQEFTAFINSGQLYERGEELHAHPFINSPYGIHETKDGYIALSMAPYEKLAGALDCPELLAYTRWEDGQTHRDEIFRHTANALKKRTTREWIGHLDSLDVWCAPINGYAEVVNDPQVCHNKIFRAVEHPELGEMKIVSAPIGMSKTPPTYRTAPQNLGESNTAVLQSLGYTAADIDGLDQRKVIQNNPPKSFKI